MKEKIFQLLDNLEIKYQNFEHEPTFTCDQAKWVDEPGVRVKNLLLKNKKKNNFYMVVLEDEKRLDSNIIRKYFWESKVSFVDEEVMKQKIWVTPWHVSPLSLMSNQENDVQVVFDKVLENKQIWIHPWRNDNTTVIWVPEVVKFIENIWNKYHFLEL